MTKRANLRQTISPVKVDRDKGIVYGCRLAEVNTNARFAGPDGQPVEITITPTAIDALLSLWMANERGDAHWTHKWAETGEDALNTRVATWRNFRKDDAGNLLADAYVWPGTGHELAIFNAAENDPKGMMVSQVFDYNGTGANIVPTRVHAADFVGKGAATTALLASFSETNPNKDMDINELINLFKTNTELRTAVLSACAPDPAADNAMVLQIEKLAGVEDADRKPEDAAQPALMRACLSVHRATLRKSVAVEVKLSDGQIEEIAKKAEVAILAGVGKLPPRVNLNGDQQQQQQQQEPTKHAFLAKVEEIEKTGCKPNLAILRAQQDHPALYNDWMKAKGIFKA